MLRLGRDAVDRHDWAAARDAFIAADRDEPLGPADLKRLAEAAWWAGYPDESVDAYERAFSGFVTAGDKEAAAYIAVQLAYQALRRQAAAVGAGWLEKASQLLDGEPVSGAHAWLDLLKAARAVFVDDEPEAAVDHLDRAIALSEQLGVPDVHALATSFKGFAMISAGAWQDGSTLIDRAATAAVSGELEPRVACDVYCNTIAACRNMGDYGRAGEWTDEAERWMHRHSLGGYPGICRVHRAELKRLHGSYAEAEQQARVASEELQRYRLLDAVGAAHKELGEVRLRRGDLDSAGESFRAAYEYGSAGQPGIALLMLCRGDAAGAAASIAGGLAATADTGETGVRLSRAHLLPAQVTIALANDDLDAARAAAEELEQIAAEFERPAFEARVLAARGAIAFHEGRHDEAIPPLDRAWRAWRDIDFPYEAAQARVLLGRARTAAGDEATARMDLEAARAAFERLGAVFELRRVDQLLGDDAGPVSGDGRRVAKTFMFTDIVTSTDLVELLGDAAWENLLRWHDRAVRSEFAKHRGQEVRHTGDGFFVAFDSAADGVEAAVAIQRRLAKHRAEHGFAPWVRIGLHTAEATPQGSDYAGSGVHVAARVGDIGEREEIVVSADALEAAGAVRFPVSEARSVPLKGVKDDVAVHTVEWR